MDGRQSVLSVPKHRKVGLFTQPSTFEEEMEEVFSFTVCDTRGYNVCHKLALVRLSDLVKWN